MKKHEQMKEVFDENLKRVNRAKERISELEDKKIQTFQTVMREEKKERASKNCGIITKVVICTKVECQKAHREWSRKIFEIIMANDLPKLVSDANP